MILYLHAENEILKEQLNKKGVKLKLSNHQRRKLAKRGKKLGSKGLLEYASIVTNEEINVEAIRLLTHGHDLCGRFSNNKGLVDE